ncbi:unnamed protein product [Orchesella dallaii]|uniref:Voltage-dependent anion-selective channel n=1 Tax=Orchesella dallaii TaxID=48710 RepID=A0ABP1S5U8_9HEXA
MSCKPANGFPTFSELGKECKDLFQKGYHIGLFKINVKNTTCHGIEVTTSGTHTIDDKSGKGEVQIKAKYPQAPGLATTTRWDTENIYTNEISFQDPIPGGKVGLNLRLNGDTGAKGGAVQFLYEHRNLTLDASFDGGEGSNMLAGASIVGGHKGLLAGYKLKFDANENALKANDLALGYRCRDYGVLLALDNLSVVNGTYYNQVNRQVQVGASAVIGAEGGPQFSLAGRYLFNLNGHTIRAKIDNQSVLGLGMELKVMPGFMAFASGSIDLKNFTAGPHKVGFGLEFGY